MMGRHVVVEGVPMSLPPAGWYPDPAGGAAPRWWDGSAWAAATPIAPQASYPPVIAAPPQQWDASPPVPVGGGWQARAGGWNRAAPVGARGRNRYSLITFGVVALYLVLAVAAHVAILGIFPILMAVRSVRAREPLAPVAVVAAVIAVIVGVTAFAHH